LFDRYRFRSTYVLPRSFAVSLICICKQLLEKESPLETMNIPNKKRRKKTIRLKSPLHNDGFFTIDKDDYITVCQIIKMIPDGTDPGRRFKDAVYTKNRRVVELDLLDFFMSIKSIPHEIGTLSSLKRLRAFCRGLERLPDSIGKLVNLEVLDLQRSGITSLPDSIVNLESLKFLFLHDTPLVNNNPHGPPTCVWTLLRNCNTLVSMGSVYQNNEKLHYALACNRFRTRTGLYAAVVTPIGPTLWPHALQNATSPFRKYSFVPRVLDHGFSRQKIVDMSCEVSKSDAIYQLLKDRRDSFVGVLIHRNTTHH